MLSLLPPLVHSGCSCYLVLMVHICVVVRVHVHATVRVCVRIVARVLAHPTAGSLRITHGFVRRSFLCARQVRYTYLRFCSLVARRSSFFNASLLIVLPLYCHSPSRWFFPMVLHFLVPAFWVRCCSIVYFLLNIINISYFQTPDSI